MSDTDLTRKREFKKALIDADMTAIEWARANDVTTTHVNRVIADPRQSAPLTAKIDAFIRAPKKPKLARAS
jgi:hypothetical protein